MQRPGMTNGHQHALTRVRHMYWAAAPGEKTMRRPVAAARPTSWRSASAAKRERFMGSSWRLQGPSLSLRPSEPLSSSMDRLLP
jgi:hypothetical protein